MRWALAALLALTALRLVLAAYLPLTPDEAYYFAWSRHLQAGYLDHPPMAALWMRAGTFISGDGPLGVRLLGPVAAALGSALLWDAGERLLPGRRLGLAAAALLNATLLAGVGAILLTPDTPLLFFWTLGLAALARLVESGNPRWWLAVGAAAGLMLLSKYTAALFMVPVFLWLVFTPAMRPHLRTVWPWAGMALALLVFSPDIAWNAAHGWASYFKQGGREAAFNPARAAQFFGELVGGQALLLTPVSAVLAACGLWRLGRDATPGARLLLWLTLLPGAVFVEHVLSDRVQGNWVAVLYPTACIAAACVAGRWLRLALAVGFGFTVLAYLQAVAAPFPLPARMDTTALQLAGWRGLAQDAAAGKPAFITSDDYATAAILAYYAPKDVPVLGFGTRWGYFGWNKVDAKGEAGIMITRRKNAPCTGELGTVTRMRGDKPVMAYRLCAFIAPGHGAEFPRP